jgi:hypothetical protein
MAERNNNRSQSVDEHPELRESDSGKRSPATSLFERFEEHGQYWITRNVGTKTFYVQWYDGDSRQTRRASLKTKSSSEATKKVEILVANAVTGDPREALAEKPMEFVGQALEYYRSEYVAALRSKKAAESAIDNFLLPSITVAFLL